jgi:hypothetical protein
MNWKVVSFIFRLNLAIWGGGWCNGCEITDFIVVNMRLWNWFEKFIVLGYVRVILEIFIVLMV